MTVEDQTLLIKQTIEKIRSSETPTILKLRKLFFLRNILTPESSESICEVLRDRSITSVLLKHEFAYVLGQMRMENSKKTLMEVLSNKTAEDILKGNNGENAVFEAENDITRHECAESLGNFHFDADIVKVLQEVMEEQKDNDVLRESCYLALKKISEVYSIDAFSDSYNIDRSSNFILEDYVSPFGSYDPALPPLAKYPQTLISSLDINDIEAVEKMYADPSACLYIRYKLMFHLRNLNTKRSAQILGESLLDERNSKLFKHEVAFCFGQMTNNYSIPYLSKSLADTHIGSIVRHETAEALGNIGDKECLRVLKEFENESDLVVKESVLVGLDVYDYVVSEGRDEYCEA